MKYQVYIKTYNNNPHTLYTHVLYLYYTKLTLTHWRLVPSILGLGSMGNVCYSKIKSSSTGSDLYLFGEGMGKVCPDKNAERKVSQFL